MVLRVVTAVCRRTLDEACRNEVPDGLRIACLDRLAVEATHKILVVYGRDDS